MKFLLVGGAMLVTSTVGRRASIVISGGHIFFFLSHGLPGIVVR